MVTHTELSPDRDLDIVARLVWTYVGCVAATIVALAFLSAVAQDQATDEAWGHAIVVAFFAVLLPLRLRAARAGSRRARIAVGVIGTALLVVNLVEAAIPGFFPPWMRVEMIAIAAVMGVVAFLALRRRA